MSFQSGGSRFRRATQLVRPYRKPAVILLLLALAGAVAGVVEPLLLKDVFDAMAQEGGNFANALRLGLLLGAVELVRQSLGLLSNWLIWRTRLRMHHGLLEAAVGRLHRTSPSSPDAQGVGAIFTRLDKGIQGSLNVFVELVQGLLPSIFYLGVSAFLMIRLEPRLAALALACAPLPALIGLLAVPAQTRRERVLMDRWSRIYSRFREVLSGIVTVRSFAQEDREKERFLKDVADSNDIVVRGVAVDSGVGALQGLAAGLARVGLILYGSWLALRGDTTGGTVVAFLGYLQGLFGPVRGLTGLYGTLQRASVCLDVLLGLLDAPEGVRDCPTAVHLRHVRGEVEFRAVSFRYPGSERKVLDGLQLRVAPGETVALVGPSGTGKTTLMALLQRFFDPTGGAVLLDGMDLRFLRQQSLRKRIGVVAQDPFLFDDTIRDNIAYGAPEKPFEAIREAARAAQCLEFIERLPAGFEARIGEGACRLSGGERQRLAIARALLKDPPLLILDEATSALDAESEHLVQEALARLLRGRTSFVIAHRFSTVVRADRIVVLRHGRILEEGRHADLMAAGGYYRSLVGRQVDGLLRDLGPGTRAQGDSPPSPGGEEAHPLRTTSSGS